MLSSLRARLSFANVMSVIALFASLGGAAYAGGVLPPNSVGTAQLKANAVISAKIKDGTLKKADFGRGQLKAGPKGVKGDTGPAGPAGPATTPDPALYYSKAQENARFLGGALVTEVASSDSIATGMVGSATATCPAGYEVIAGGSDAQNVRDMTLTSSGPIIEGLPVFSAPVGQHAAPTAWRAYMVNGDAAAEMFKVAAVCAPVG